MQNLPTIEISDFYIEFIGYALSILVIMWITLSSDTLLWLVFIRDVAAFA